MQGASPPIAATNPGSDAPCAGPEVALLRIVSADATAVCTTYFPAEANASRYHLSATPVVRELGAAITLVEKGKAAFLTSLRIGDSAQSAVERASVQPRRFVRLLRKESILLQTGSPDHRGIWRGHLAVGPEGTIREVARTPPTLSTTSSGVAGSAVSFRRN